jgi:surface antigen
LYNLQPKDYDNNLVNYSSWKEIAGELHAHDKGTFTKDTALSQNDRVVVGRVVAGERYENGMVCMNRPSTRQGNGMGTAWHV